MQKTSIEWVKNPDGSQGFTFNPITGCLNHVNGLCRGGMFPCYAYGLANGRLRKRYLANLNLANIECKDHYRELEIEPAEMFDPFYPRFWPERLNDFVVHPKSRKGIFVCDMGELFGDWIPKEWQGEIFSVIRAHPQHRFYLLTKQPQNLQKFSPFPDNCWVGITCTNRKQLLEAREVFNDGIGRIYARTKFISFEPLLDKAVCNHEFKNINRDPLSAQYCVHCGKGHSWDINSDLKGINWLIIGAQTKPYRPPEIESVREIVSAADRAGIAVFLKNNLYPLLGLGNGKSILHNNCNGTLRQEMPK